MHKKIQNWKLTIEALVAFLAISHCPMAWLAGIIRNTKRYTVKKG
jgi:hypothetical protein